MSKFNSTGKSTRKFSSLVAVRQTEWHRGAAHDANEQTQQGLDGELGGEHVQAEDHQPEQCLSAGQVPQGAAEVQLSKG